MKAVTKILEKLGVSRENFHGAKGTGMHFQRNLKMKAEADLGDKDKENIVEGAGGKRSKKARQT